MRRHEENQFSRGAHRRILVRLNTSRWSTELTFDLLLGSPLNAFQKPNRLIYCMLHQHQRAQVLKSPLLVAAILTQAPLAPNLSVQLPKQINQLTTSTQTRIPFLSWVSSTLPWTAQLHTMHLWLTVFSLKLGRSQIVTQILENCRLRILTTSVRQS